LGRGGVNLCKELPLEGSEGKTHPETFEHRLVHEEEGFPLPGPIIDAHRFPWPPRANGDVSIVSTAKGVKVIQVGVTAVVLQVLEGG